jgi:hypothetical protein
MRIRVGIHGSKAGSTSSWYAEIPRFRARPLGRLASDFRAIMTEGASCAFQGRRAGRGVSTLRATRTARKGCRPRLTRPSEASVAAIARSDLPVARARTREGRLLRPGSHEVHAVALEGKAVGDGVYALAASPLCGERCTRAGVGHRPFVLRSAIDDRSQERVPRRVAVALPVALTRRAPARAAARSISAARTTSRATRSRRATTRTPARRAPSAARASRSAGRASNGVTRRPRRPRHCPRQQPLTRPPPGTRTSSRASRSLRTSSAEGLLYIFRLDCLTRTGIADTLTTRRRRLRPERAARRGDHRHKITRLLLASRS